MLWPKKNSYMEFDNEKIFLRLENSPPPPPITFLLVRPLSDWVREKREIFQPMTERSESRYKEFAFVIRKMHATIYFNYAVHTVSNQESLLG